MRARRLRVRVAVSRSLPRTCSESAPPVQKKSGFRRACFRADRVNPCLGQAPAARSKGIGIRSDGTCDTVVYETSSNARARRGCGRSIIRATTARSCSTPTATTSRQSATRPSEPSRGPWRAARAPCRPSCSGNGLASRVVVDKLEDSGSKDCSRIALLGDGWYPLKLTALVREDTVSPSLGDSMQDDARRSIQAMVKIRDQSLQVLVIS